MAGGLCCCSQDASGCVDEEAPFWKENSRLKTDNVGDKDDVCGRKKKKGFALLHKAPKGGHR